MPDKVLITKSKLDSLANAIANKSGESLPLTLDEMEDAVEEISVGADCPTFTVEMDSQMTSVTSASCDKTYNECRSYINNGQYGCIINVVVGSASMTIGAASVSSGSSFVRYAAVTQGINTLEVMINSNEEVDGILNSIPSRSSSDLTVSGATIIAPAGYYSSSASASVSSGTEGTPTATKGTVSNHSISVTPSVTNSAGYISGSTKNGTAVTVSASELVSGTLTVDSSGTKDVTNYASASVPAGTAGTPSATKGTVSNHSVSVTPSVTNSTGWISGGTKTGTAVTVSASELVSGNKEITENGTNIDVSTYSTVSVAVPSSGSKNVQVVQGTTRTNSSSLTAIGGTLTVSKTGTYDIYYSTMRTNTSSSYIWATQLYIGGTAYGSENTTWTNNVQNVHLTNISLTANQALRVYGRESRGTSYYVYAPMIAIVEQ